MTTSEICRKVFTTSIENYHVEDHVDQALKNPYNLDTFENLLYKKNWIDTVQWHLEDLIREPSINPTEALALKRRIDTSNQERTTIVEEVDDHFLHQFQEIEKDSSTMLNTESPAWAIDRYSILFLKIFHMRIEANREGITTQKKQECTKKLNLLEEQEKDLSSSIDQLISDYETGKKYMKVYRQVKMYNDPELNPVLYNKKG